MLTGNNSEYFGSLRKESLLEFLVVRFVVEMRRFCLLTAMELILIPNHSCIIMISTV